MYQAVASAAPLRLLPPERADGCRQIGQALYGQLTDQNTQVEALRTAYRKLEEKLNEARHASDAAGAFSYILMSSTKWRF